jgi:molybdopterin/thiamine biosynthesis adenylyltransferase
MARRLVTEKLLDFENDRNATLKLIDWFDIARVHSAKVLVVGAGAIGNEVLKNLALLGIGNIYILDRDTIEMSNLSRSILYRAIDNGRSKASTAAAAVREINPSIKVFWCCGDIASDLGEGFIRRMDVVIGCLDSVEARYLLNRLCWRVGRPWVDAGIGVLNGEVRVFEPPDGPCYECAFTDAHYRQLPSRLPCNALASAYLRQGKIPTTPTIASIVAGVQVQECLKLLNPSRWRGRTLSGRQFIFNGTICNVDIVDLPLREDCPAHMEIDPDAVIELSDLTAETTAAELLEKACELLGTSAHLYLGSEIGIERKCPECDHTISLFRPVHKIFSDELTCVGCGRKCEWESDITTTHIVNASSSQRAMLNAKLSDLGVPRFGIVEARASDGKVSFLELAGDKVCWSAR